MLGMRGEDEEQPARRSAGGMLVMLAEVSGGRENVQSRIMAMAMRIMSTWW